MQNPRYKLLVWLPSPVGDAILSTPALRAIRQHFQSSEIAFFAKPGVRQVLSPGSFNDMWLEQQNDNPFAIARILKHHKFTHAILFKNSFGSGLATFLAKIPLRIGYAREGRSLFLTDILYPAKLPDGKFKPLPMIDYYLDLASSLGADTADRSLELSVTVEDELTLWAKLPELARPEQLVVVMVPGGAFGPSKCWPSVKFAKAADWLIDNYDATVVISVACDPMEQQIAAEICDASKHKLISLADRPLTLGELKALFSNADLVISNDTGPRHIAIALRRKVITLFGPNDPAWTDTGYQNEIKIIGGAACAPCAKPICKKREHLCMEAITAEMVCDAAKKLLESSRSQPTTIRARELTDVSKSFFVHPDYVSAFGKLGLTTIEAVFSFNAGKNLSKNDLAAYRSRLQFEINPPASLAPITAFLKRYDRPPILTQIRNWLSLGTRASCAFSDFESANKLSAKGISTPKAISYGEQWATFFEKRSFIITEKIPSAESLERKLPDYFTAPATADNLRVRRSFIHQLAAFIKKFHDTNYCHRDLYLSHIFYSDNGRFYLIDLARAFQPHLFAKRFRRKDIAQLYYSAPARYFSRTDRLRFYLEYTGQTKVTSKDKAFIRKVTNKARRMARHDIKHGRVVPYAR